MGRNWCDLGEETCGGDSLDDKSSRLSHHDSVHSRAFVSVLVAAQRSAQPRSDQEEELLRAVHRRCSRAFPLARGCAVDERLRFSSRWVWPARGKPFLLRHQAGEQPSRQCCGCCHGRMGSHTTVLAAGIGLLSPILHAVPGKMPAASWWAAWSGYADGWF